MVRLRPVTRVEVSVDGGATWADADGRADRTAYAWARWRWTVAGDAPGLHELVVRATDATGPTQPVDQRWNRQAMANNHGQRVTVFVR